MDFRGCAARPLHNLHLAKYAECDCLTGVKGLSPSRTACLFLAVACLAWIGGISLALVYFLGLSDGIGWTIAGTLEVFCIVAAYVLLFEFRHAVDLTSIGDAQGVGTYPSPPLMNSVSIFPPPPSVPVPSFGVSHETR